MGRGGSTNVASLEESAGAAAFVVIGFRIAFVVALHAVSHGIGS